MSRNARVRRLVVKIGTSLLTRKGGELDDRRIARFAHELSAIQKKKVEVIVVTSGAIAAGLSKLGLKKRPQEMGQKQAAAAVGQIRLMEGYRKCFSQQGVTVGQVLLTREDFEKHGRSLNAQATLEALLKADVIPVINENDTVAVEEIRFGDNDTLAALVAVLVQADLVVLLTDVEGLMTRPPHHGKGELIPYIEHIDPQIEALAHDTTGKNGGTGGMQTKIRAAKYSTTHGVDMVIASGHKPGLFAKLLAGQAAGTFFRRQAK